MMKETFSHPPKHPSAKEHQQKKNSEDNKNYINNVRNVAGYHRLKYLQPETESSLNGYAEEEL